MAQAPDAVDRNGPPDIGEPPPVTFPSGDFLRGEQQGGLAATRQFGDASFGEPSGNDYGFGQPLPVAPPIGNAERADMAPAVAPIGPSERAGMAQPYAPQFQPFDLGRLINSLNPFSIRVPQTLAPDASYETRPTLGSAAVGALTTAPKAPDQLLDVLSGGDPNKRRSAEAAFTALGSVFQPEGEVNAAAKALRGIRPGESVAARVATNADAAARDAAMARMTPQQLEAFAGVATDPADLAAIRRAQASRAAAANPGAATNAALAEARGATAIEGTGAVKTGEAGIRGNLAGVGTEPKATLGSTLAARQKASLDELVARGEVTPEQAQAFSTGMAPPAEPVRPILTAEGAAISPGKLTRAIQSAVANAGVPLSRDPELGSAISAIRDVLPKDKWGGDLGAATQLVLTGNKAAMARFGPDLTQKLLNGKVAQLARDNKVAPETIARGLANILEGAKNPHDVLRASPAEIIAAGSRTGAEAARPAVSAIEAANASVIKAAEDSVRSAPGAGPRPDLNVVPGESPLRSAAATDLEARQRASVAGGKGQPGLHLNNNTGMYELRDNEGTLRGEGKTRDRAIAEAQKFHNAEATLTPDEVRASRQRLADQMGLDPHTGEPRGGPQPNAVDARLDAPAGGGAGGGRPPIGEGVPGKSPIPEPQPGATTSWIARALRVISGTKSVTMAGDPSPLFRQFHNVIALDPASWLRGARTYLGALRDPAMAARVNADMFEFARSHGISDALLVDVPNARGAALARMNDAQLAGFMRTAQNPHDVLAAAMEQAARQKGAHAPVTGFGARGVADAADNFADVAYAPFRNIPIVGGVYNWTWGRWLARNEPAVEAMSNAIRVGLANTRMSRIEARLGRPLTDAERANISNTTGILTGRGLIDMPRNGFTEGALSAANSLMSSPQNAAALVRRPFVVLGSLKNIAGDLKAGRGPNPIDVENVAVAAVTVGADWMMTQLVAKAFGGKTDGDMNSTAFGQVELPKNSPLLGLPVTVLDALGFGTNSYGGKTYIDTTGGDRTLATLMARIISKPFGGQATTATGKAKASQDVLSLLEDYFGNKLYGPGHTAWQILGGKGGQIDWGDPTQNPLSSLFIQMAVSSGMQSVGLTDPGGPLRFSTSKADLTRQRAQNLHDQYLAAPAFSIGNQQEWAQVYRTMQQYRTLTKGKTLTEIRADPNLRNFYNNAMGGRFRYYVGDSGAVRKQVISPQRLAIQKDPAFRHGGAPTLDEIIHSYR